MVKRGKPSYRDHTVSEFQASIYEGLRPLQGKRIKISGKQNVTAEVVIPSGLQTFLLDAELGRLFLKQIETQVADRRHDSRRAALADMAGHFQFHELLIEGWSVLSGSSPTPLVLATGQSSLQLVVRSTDDLL